MRMKISPSILSADFARLGEEIKNIEPYADYIHIDVMDGHFVPNLTVGVPVVESIRKITKLPLDVHLMIENPEDFIGAFSQAGADFIVVHAETITGSEIFETIRRHGKKPGVSLNPDTPLGEIEPYLSEVDMAVVMSVNPGFSGQGFIDVTDKIKKLRSSFDKDIEVDGGIKPHNIKKVADAGANVFVSGSGIFGTDSPAETIRRMREKIE